MSKAIFLFNKTEVAPRAWLDAGYECWCFDGQHTSGIQREGNLIKVGMWFDADKIDEHIRQIADTVGDGTEFICSFAECTYLTTTGARWFYHPDDKHLPVEIRRPHPLYPNRREDQQKAVLLTRMVEKLANYLGVTCWVLENPAINNLNTMWRRPDYKFHPFQFGGYLSEEDIHPVYPNNYPPRDAYRKNTGLWCGPDFKFPRLIPVDPVPGDFHQVTKRGGRSLLTKNIRSMTPRGFAKAMFEANGARNG
jgi:hypothetical protein